MVEHTINERNRRGPLPGVTPSGAHEVQRFDPSSARWYAYHSSVDAADAMAVMRAVAAGSADDPALCLVRVVNPRGVVSASYASDGKSS